MGIGRVIKYQERSALVSLICTSRSYPDAHEGEKAAVRAILDDGHVLRGSR